MSERRPYGDGTPAQRYERAYPGTGIPEAQKQERQERMDLKEAKKSHHATARTRLFTFPNIPWHDDE
jgi:hypothetical protein